MHHIVEGIKKYGLVYTTWMYPYERFNFWMCQSFAKATIMQTYSVCVCVGIATPSSYMYVLLVVNLANVASGLKFNMQLFIYMWQSQVENEH